MIGGICNTCSKAAAAWLSAASSPHSLRRLTSINQVLGGSLWDGFNRTQAAAFAGSLRAVHLQIDCNTAHKQSACCGLKSLLTAFRWSTIKGRQ
jgi:hypothetical protein